jgi:uncharacterized protein YjiS (DUF1127 family)
MSSSSLWQTARPAYDGHFEAAHRARSEALRALVAIIAGRLKAWRQRRRRPAAIRDLQALDDRLLADLNLDRATIKDVVEGMLERER